MHKAYDAGRRCFVPGNRTERVRLFEAVSSGQFQSPHENPRNRARTSFPFAVSMEGQELLRSAVFPPWFPLREVTPAAGSSDRKRSYLRWMRRAAIPIFHLFFVGRRGTLGCACAEAALDFGLDVAAQSFRNDSGSSEFAEVGNSKLWQVGENGGQRRGRLAEESDSNVV